MKTKRLLAWALTVIMALSCLSVLPMAVSAETAPIIDGEKDAIYTDAKSMTVTSAYAGVGQAATENTTQATIKTYYAWDDSYNYVYMEISEPGYTYTGKNADLIYYVNSGNASGYFFQSVGGGYVQWTLAQGVGSATSAGSNLAPAELGGYMDGATGQTRRYEIKFDRDPSATGFFVSPVIYGSDTYVVSYHSFYSTNGHFVKYDDESTWVYTDVTTPEPDPTPDPDPTPEPEPTPTPTPSEDGLDAIKDERYTEEKCTTMSTAYAGSGGGKVVNSYHIYTKLYYTWDDNFNYVYFEIHDPFMTQGLDLLYYITNTNAAAGNMFQQAGGGYLQWDANGNMTASTDVDGRTIRYASFVGDGVRQYEVILPKTEGAIGLQLSPVAWRDNGGFSVSYDTNYYLLPNKNILYENQAGHWTDTSRVDEEVMTDPARIEAVEEELKKLPADASALTYENDKAAVDAATAAVETIPAGWRVFLDETLYAHYNACKAKMDELEAAARADEIKAVEDKIDALPAPADANLDHVDAVEEIKEMIAALDGVADYINADKMAKYNAVASRVDALQAPIKVDGKKDGAYGKDDPWAIEQGYLFSSQSDMYLTPTDSYGVLETMADDKYVYIYFEVFDDNGVVNIPDDVEWNSNMVHKYDTVITYLDMDPLNVVTGTPYKDADQAGDAMFYFNMLADGTIPAFSGKTQFLADASNFVPFQTETTYGYEMRVPRVEGEESFKINVVFTDPVYDDAGEVDPLSMQIALGAEWSYNYIGYGEKWLDEYPTFMNYLEVIELIDSLPQVEDMVDNSCKNKAAKAREALDLLNEDQRAFVSDETVAHLEAVEAALPTLPPPPTDNEIPYGDLNGDKAVDAKDALLVLQIAVNKVEGTDEMKAAGDVNGDKAIDAKDALLILQKAVDKIDKFPVENK